MRIPIPDLPRASTRAVGTPYSSLNHDTGLRNVAQGIHQLGAGGQQLAQGIAVAQERAAVTDSTDKQTDYEKLEAWANAGVAPDADFAKKYEPPPVAGYFNTKGKAASEHAAATQEWLEKQRLALKKSLPNVKAQELFDKRSDDYLQQVRRRMTTHETQQVRAAEVASAEASRSRKLKSLAYNYKDDGLAEQLINDHRGTVRALAISPEQGEAEDQQWQEDATKVRISAALEANDWQAAEVLYTKAGSLLAGDSKGIADAIRKKRIGVQSETYALDIVKSARGKDGRPDEAAVYAAIEKLPEELRKETRGIAREYVIEADGAWKAEKEEVEREAQAAFNEAGGRFSKIPQALRDRLNQLSPTRYTELEDKARSRYDRWRKHRDDDAGARREQGKINKAALERFDTLDPRERAEMDVDTFLANNPDLAVDKWTRTTLQKEQAKARRTVESGEAEGEEAFMRDARAMAVGRVKGKAEADQFLAKARRDYDNWRIDNKKAPNREQVQQILGGVVLDVEVPRKLGPVTLGTKKVPAWQAGDAAPKPKRIRDPKTGRTGRWDGVSPLPPGVEVIDG